MLEHSSAFFEVEGEGRVAVDGRLGVHQLLVGGQCLYICDQCLLVGVLSGKAFSRSIRISWILQRWAQFKRLHVELIIIARLGCLPLTYGICLRRLLCCWSLLDFTYFWCLWAASIWCLWTASLVSLLRADFADYTDRNPCQY